MNICAHMHYCVECTICGIQYVGETEGPMNGRASDHLRYIYHGDNEIHEDLGTAKEGRTRKKTVWDCYLLDLVFDQPGLKTNDTFWKTTKFN